MSTHRDLPLNTPTLCELSAPIEATDKRHAVGTFRGGLLAGTLVVAERDHRNRYILELPLTGEQNLYTASPGLVPVDSVSAPQLRFLFSGSALITAMQAFALLAGGASVDSAASAVARAGGGYRVNVADLRSVVVSATPPPTPVAVDDATGDADDAAGDAAGDTSSDATAGDPAAAGAIATAPRRRSRGRSA